MQPWTERRQTERLAVFSVSLPPPVRYTRGPDGRAAGD